MLSIRLSLTLAFTTPPTPNAGIILAIRAMTLIAQFFLIMIQRWRQWILGSCRLYKSSPSRCRGVLSSCTVAGAANCAIVWPFMYCCNSGLNWRVMDGPIKVGTLKEAKIVKQSRIVKRVRDEEGTVSGLAWEPKSCANFASLNKLSPTFVIEEAINLATPLETSSRGRFIIFELNVSAALAVKYVPP